MIFIRMMTGALGSMVLRQNIGPDGLNLVDAHTYISSLAGEPVVITDWHLITQKRFDQMIEYCTKLTEQMKLRQIEAETPAGRQRGKFTVHDGGKSGGVPGENEATNQADEGAKFSGPNGERNKDPGPDGRH